MRPGIPRVTWTTDHFTLTIDERKQDLLPRLAALAEECFAKQQAYFGYAPSKRIQMVFLDEGDYANGYAYPPQEWVVIFLHSAEHQLRGRTRWLPGVIAHELGHIFTLRRMGDDSYFLGMDLFHMWSGKGNSSFDESFSWHYNGIPPWLAEGLAQYAAGVCGYDTLDTHRQMVLRVAAASGALLSLAEMKAFAWDGRRNEMIYAQGYALVTHLYRTYGAKAANHYLESAASKGWRGAFEPAFGKSLDAIYGEWRKALEAGSQGAEAGGDGDFILPEAPGPYTVESFPVPLADNRFLYLSSGDNDYGGTDLMLADGKGGTREIFSRVTSITASGGGRSALFTSTHYGFAQGDQVSDLYAFEAGTGSIRRLTTGGRILRGCESGGIIYGIRNHEGRTSLVRIADGDWSTIWVPPDTLELTDLAVGHAPGTLTLGTTSGFGADIRELDLASGDLSPLAISPQDERDPRWHGDTLYFTADYSGVFDVYALVDEQVVRLTHSAGGAFHPTPRQDGLWISAYGPKGFRLARARKIGESAPPFVVQLPVPGWKLPSPVEYEGDAFDRTSLGLIGFNLSLGIIRSPGYSLTYADSLVDTAGGTPASGSFSYEDGTRALTGVSLYLQNPSGLVEASLTLGITRPLDYEGPMHLDQSSAEFRVNAFLPSLVVGGDYGAFDLPNVRSDGRRFIYYQASLTGYAGMELLISDHWAGAARMTVRNDFGFAGSDGDKVNDSDPHFGGTGDLAYSNLEFARDGVVRGFTGFARGEIVPRVNPTVPEFSVTAGGTAYASANRFLFLDASLYHTQDFADAATGWVYGGASAYCAIPLGMQLGTRGGAGLFLDRIMPGIEYRNMSRFITPDVPDGSASASNRSPHAGSAAPKRGPSPFRSGTIAAVPVRGFQAYSPRAGGLNYMLDRETSHEAGITLTLKTVGFFARPERWRAGVIFDAEDFARDPMWTVSVSL